MCVLCGIRSRDSCDFALDHPGLEDGQTAATQSWPSTLIQTEQNRLKKRKHTEL